MACLALACAARPAKRPAAGDTQPRSAPTARPGSDTRSSAEGAGTAGVAELLRDAVLAARREGGGAPEAGDLGGALHSVYERTGWGALWLGDGRATPQASAVLAHLARAGESGLRPGDYDATGLTSRVAAMSPRAAPADLARLDVALSLALLRNLSDLRVGRANPERARFSIGAGQDALVGLVGEIASARDAASLLANAGPRWDGYTRLRRALVRYRTLASDPSFQPPGDLTGLRPGGRSPQVPALRRWLEALGDAPVAGPATARSDVYDRELVLAMKHFQERHGLAPDGTIGKGTAQALRVPLSERVRQIERTLERWRWLPEPGPQPPIVVNIPEFRLFVPQGASGTNGETPDMKVIVGEAGKTETPELSGEMEYLVFRPAWGVPHSIVVNEMLAKIRKNPAYLAGERLEIVGGGAPTQAVSKATLAGLASGALGLRQRPGPENSLGLVKFVFPNDDDIYLHATPAKSLFSRARRDFSHGCIRVEEPVELAQYVLRSDPAWTRERVRTAMDGGGTRQVDLASPIPVHVVYFTAAAGPGGEVRFFDDLYRRDEALQSLLSGGTPQP
ncbi:MAG: L,D-transpeptidase family protein [Deltaproteobacteria bacterium]|nr:L,D-transpeptidase family protein [Deltaproteobacteria bacterium]